MLRKPGKIYKLGVKSIQYKVQSLNELETVMLHFNTGGVVPTLLAK